MNDMGAFTGSRPTGQAQLHDLGGSRFDPEREVARVLSMAKAWDDAANALKRLDLDGFDTAMARFSTLKEQQS